MSEDNKNISEEEENKEAEEEQIPDLMLAKQQIEERELKIKEFEEMAKRARAEAENMRKRMEKEKRDLVQYANKNLLVKFLDFMDDFERALKHRVDGEGKDFFTGVEMIYKRLTSFLEENGVTEIKCLDEEFDPNIHEAIGLEEDEKYKEEIVIEVYQKGYKMYDDLLRSAKVKIGKPPIAAKSNDENDEE